jgi:hypothetical protein
MSNTIQCVPRSDVSSQVEPAVERQRTQHRSEKITDEHLRRIAIVYVRQSTQHQVLEHRESTARQYALADRATALGWPAAAVEVIDEVQGHSGSSPNVFVSERGGPLSDSAVRKLVARAVKQVYRFPCIPTRPARRGGDMNPYEMAGVALSDLNTGDLDAPAATKAKLDSILTALAANEWKCRLKVQPAIRIIESGLTSKNLPLAIVAAEIAARQRPLTLRGLFYRVVSAGWLPSTDKQHYKRLGRVLTRLREHGCIPFNWIVDNLRSTMKPSSWSGLNDYAEAVRDHYRRDFWANLPDYVHIFCEKDAIAGSLAPVTSLFDVALPPVSLSFSHEIAAQWIDIDKPIHAYYVGDSTRPASILSVTFARSWSGIAIMISIGNGWPFCPRTSSGSA